MHEAQPEETHSRRPPPTGPRKWHQNPWLWATVAGLITIPLLRPCLRQIPDPPAVVAELPGFALVDQAGEPFGSEDLRGEVYLANTFFTSCQSVCPPLMEAMASLQARLEREEDVRGQPLDIHLVSISVDPSHDTPEVLRAYGEQYGVDPERWTLVTGDEEAIRAIVVGGFMTDMGDRQVDPANVSLFEISHSAKLVMVDPFGRIRGYYDTDDSGLDEAFHRATHVLRVRDEEAEELQASRGQ